MGHKYDRPDFRRKKNLAPALGWQASTSPFHGSFWPIAPKEKVLFLGGLTPGTIHLGFHPPSRWSTPHVDPSSTVAVWNPPLAAFFRSNMFCSCLKDLKPGLELLEINSIHYFNALRSTWNNVKPRKLWNPRMHAFHKSTSKPSEILAQAPTPPIPAALPAAPAEPLPMALGRKDRGKWHRAW